MSRITGQIRTTRELSDILLGLGEAVLSADVVDREGNVISSSVRRGYESELSFDRAALDKWGEWAAIMMSVVEQSDRMLSKTEYVIVGRGSYKALYLPVYSHEVIVVLVVNKSSEPSLLVRKVRNCVKASWPDYI